MTESELDKVKDSVIAEIQKDAEQAKEQKWVVHSHVQWIAIALFAITTICSIINTVAPKSKAAQEALKVEHVVTSHPVIEKAAASLLLKELEKLGK